MYVINLKASGDDLANNIDCVAGVVEVPDDHLLRALTDTKESKFPCVNLFGEDPDDKQSNNNSNDDDDDNSTEPVSTPQRLKNLSVKIGGELSCRTVSSACDINISTT